jgi:glycosyltransferase involved in cell wall biosynthesis
MAKTIFVQMACYRDPQLIPTLKSLIENAANPQDLCIVVCWQHGPEEKIEQFLSAGFTSHVRQHARGRRFSDHQFLYREAIIKLIDVHYHHSEGACWARNLIQQHYTGQQYTLQLDSHHRFIPNWDSELITMLEGLKAKSAKPVLTAYLPMFDPDNDPAKREKTWGCMQFDRFTPEGVIFFRAGAFKDRINYHEPVPARFYSGHFTFADGHFAKTVQHDPNYFFHGEEISIAVRAFTHGYDLYHPNKIIAWHEYTRKGRTKMWDDHTHKEKKANLIPIHWGERNDRSLRRNRILFQIGDGLGQTLDFGPYGFGTVRTLRDYEAYAGVSFYNHGVQQNVLEHEAPVMGVPPHKNDTDWINSLKRSNDVWVMVNKAGLGRLDFVASCKLTAYTEGRKVLHTQALDRKRLDQVLGEWLDTRMFFISGIAERCHSYEVELFDKNNKLLKQVKQIVRT